jgi:ABC-type bacteriocin/lantibiotic exporter with double-glycine peptidase domain
MTGAPIPPHEIERTGDDSPATGLPAYVWRMSGLHQLWVCLLAAVVAALSMVPLELQRRIVNDVIAASELELLFILGAAYLGVVVVQGGLKFALRVYQGWLTESAARYTRSHLAELHARRHEADGEGRAVTVIGAEVEKLAGFVGEGFSQPVVNIGMLLAIGGYMVVVEPLVALVSLAFLAPQAIAVPWLQRYINRRLEVRVRLMREMGDAVASDAPSADILTRIFRNRMAIYLLKFTAKAVVNLLNHAAPLAVLMFGGYLVIKGETSLGVVVAFMTGFERLSNPLRELLNYYRVAAQAQVQHELIARWM